MRSRGKLTTKVFCGPGSTCATISVSERWPSVLGSSGLPNAAGVARVVDERARVGADDEVVGAARRRRGATSSPATRWISPTRSLMPRFTERDAGDHEHARRARARSRSGRRSRPIATRTELEVLTSGRAAPRATDRPLRATAWSAVGAPAAPVVAVGAAGQPLEVLAEHQDDVGAGERGVGDQLRAGHVGRAAAGPWRGRTPRSGSRSWSTVPRGSLLGAARHEALAR